MDNGARTKIVEEFAAALAQALSRSIAQSIGEPWVLEVPSVSVPPAEHGVPVHFRLKVDGSMRGECYIECYEPQISYLLNKMQRQAEERTIEEQGEAFAKLISAAIPDLTKALSAVYGAMTVNIDRVSGLAFGGMSVVSLAAANDPTGTSLLLYFDTHLLDALAKFADSARPDAADDRQVSPYNLKLVMDVELNVSLLFGRRRMPLRDLLDLGSGSVVELDRMVDEPVELLLDGKVIARGEAVVVDGNYGLRVTEIPQPVGSHLLN
jgi:flagellar motor switch protein FliN/FliY